MPEPKPPIHLTDAEWRALHAVYEYEFIGVASKALGIAENSLKGYLYRVSQKLNTHNIIGTFKKVGWLDDSLSPQGRRNTRTLRKAGDAKI